MSESPHAAWFASLETQFAAAYTEGAYLWPRTPIHDIQSKIKQRVGVGDREVDAPNSRPALILRQIAALQRAGGLSAAFSVLDIACGDALILLQIKSAHPAAACFGADFHAGSIDTHEEVSAAGIGLHRALIQHLFRAPVAPPFDLVLMLNTYRGWESADLKPEDRDLPALADAWLRDNARFAILTVTESQTHHFRDIGFNLQRIGPGEDNSIMVCLSRERLPAAGLLARLFSKLTT
ncbi:MAG: hypothetical protein K8R23_13585 [Chthoniobacter sp.]|nr:hypothetical protein [Chthoniobacter sp.]